MESSLGFEFIIFSHILGDLGTGLGRKKVLTVISVSVAPAFVLFKDQFSIHIFHQFDQLTRKKFAQKYPTNLLNNSPHAVLGTVRKH